MQFFKRNLFTNSNFNILVKIMLEFCQCKDYLEFIFFYEKKKNPLMYRKKKKVDIFYQPICWHLILPSYKMHGAADNIYTSSSSNKEGFHVSRSWHRFLININAITVAQFKDDSEGHGVEASTIEPPSRASCRTTRLLAVKFRQRSRTLPSSVWKRASQNHQDKGKKKKKV